MSLLSKLHRGVQVAKGLLEKFYHSTLDVPPWKRFEYAERLSDEGRIDEALDQYDIVEESLKETAPRPSYFYYSRGYTLASGGYFREALDDAFRIYTHAEDEIDTNIYFNSLMGYTFWKVGEELSAKYYREEIESFDGARGAFDVAAVMMKDGCVFSKNYAVNQMAFCKPAIKAAFNAGDYASAVEMFEKLPFDKAAAEDVLTYAKALYLIGDYIRALAASKAALEAYERSGRLSDIAYSEFLSGWCSLRLGDTEGAVASFNRAMVLSTSQDDYSSVAQGAISYLLYLEVSRQSEKTSLKEVLKLISGINPGALSFLTMKDQINIPFLSVDEAVRFLHDATVAVTRLGMGEELLRIVRLFGEYLMSGRLKIGADMPELAKKRTAEPVIDAIEKIFFYVRSQPTWEARTRCYEAAYVLARAASMIFADNIEIKMLRGRAANLLATSIDIDPKYGSSSTLFRESAEIFMGIAGSIGTANMNCDILRHYTLALSEYKEDIIDIGSAEKWEFDLLAHLAGDALLERFVRCGIDDPEAILDLGWDFYYTAKNDKSLLDGSLGMARLVLDTLRELPHATREQLGGAERLFAWNALVKAVHVLNNGNIDLAREILEREDVLGHLLVGDGLIKDKRWRKDLLYAFQGYYYAMARIMDRDRAKRALKKYVDCPPFSTFDQPGQDGALARYYFDKSLDFLEKAGAFEQRKWMTARMKGRILINKGDYTAAVRVIEETLGMVSTEKVNIVTSVLEVLVEALKCEACYGGLPPDRQIDNALRIVETSWDVAVRKGFDPKYILNEIFPNVKAAGRNFGLFTGLGTPAQIDRWRAIIRKIAAHIDKAAGDDLKRQWHEIINSFLDKGG